jgi:hypothetical protein
MLGLGEAGGLAVRSFQGRLFMGEVIPMGCLRWYLMFPVSYRGTVLIRRENPHGLMSLADE